MFSGLVADSFPFGFPKALLKLNLWLSLAYRLRPAFCTCLLAVKAHFCCSLEDAQGVRDGMEGCVGDASGALEVPRNQ